MITFVLINVRMSFMHILNEQTRETLSRKLGKTYDEILQMSAEELDALVEARIGKKLTPAFSLSKTWLIEGLSICFSNV